MKFISIVDTFLKRSPKQSKDLSKDKKVSIKKDTEIEVIKYKEDKSHWQITLNNKEVWYIFQKHWKKPDNISEIKIYTKENLSYIMPNASIQDIELYLDSLNKVANKFQITTGKRAAAFIAQLAHESGSFRYKEEIASGEAYENRTDLGNVFKGDGKKYKGRGLIQLTGRYNYKIAGEELGYPLEDNPELITEDIYLNTLVAGWFWDSKNLNSLADKDYFVSITKKINGGTTHLESREEFWERAKEVLINNKKETIDWNNPSSKISKYFVVREVTNGYKERIPKDKKIIENILELAKHLDTLREEWGSPILVNSWYRPPKVNARVGGASNSQHLYGLAVDIRPGKGDIYKFQEWLDSKWHSALGYGAPKGFVHIDNRPNGSNVRWFY